jgi:hypothetical protein
MTKKLELEIITPQFTRTAAQPAVAAPPADLVAWHQLRELSKNALRELGLGVWNDPSEVEEGDPTYGGKVLMLLPGEWYAHVPEGYELVCIDGKPEPFARGVTDDDIRFGCLAFGLLVNP